MWDLNFLFDDRLREGFNCKVEVKLLAKLFTISLESIGGKVSTRSLGSDKLNFESGSCSDFGVILGLDLIAEDTREFDIFRPLIASVLEESQILGEGFFRDDLNVRIPSSR